GQAARRTEDRRLISGGGRYTSALIPAGALQAFVLRSPHAHADFTITDADAARAMPGVKLVLTAADVKHLGAVPCLAPIPNGDGSKAPKPKHPVLAHGTVKHVGDPIAFIVADTAAQARDAAEAIAVDYTPLAVVADTRAALAPGAPLVWKDAPGNIAYDTGMGDKDKVDEIFKRAAKTVRIEIENNRLITNYMETRSVIADYDAKSESYTLTLTSQGVHGLRDVLAGMILKCPPENVRIITPDVGGGFGTKSFMYAEYPLAAEAAKRLGKTVAWVADRSDHFISDAHGRDNITLAEAALNANGEFLAMRFDIAGNLGAYLHHYGPYIHYLGATMLTGIYKTPAIYVRVRGVFTHTVPVDAYRGAGRPEAAFVLERLADACARECGLAQDEFRRRNMVPASAMPYKTPIGDRVYDTGDFHGHLAQAMQSADWAGFAARAADSKKHGKVRGIGIGSYIECTAWGSGEDVSATLEKDGTVTVTSGTQSNGQGHATAYAQFVSQHLDIPLERVNVIQGDTAVVKTGNGTGG
ncbi:MAG: xanthine dehydrogenase family protein molybdopterin-binding subunit, partial [Beijerinckiaceae bacterium]